MSLCKLGPLIHKRQCGSSCELPITCNAPASREHEGDVFVLSPHTQTTMASKGAIPVLVALMLLTGCSNTLLTKYQDMQLSLIHI